MALTDRNLALIKAVAKNDIHSARQAAVASLLEDKSKKNAGVVEAYKKMLTGNASVMMSSLPDNIRTYLVGEAPGGFDVSRYFARDTEEKIAGDVRKMKLVADELSKKRIPYRNTTLLYGESGTGKTELGRYIAYKLNLPFFYVSFVSMIDSYMGSTAKNIHKIFEFCNSIPCVLMLDEFDCVAAKRSSGGSKGVDGELERTTISIMQELDRLPNHVTLIAATNRLDMVDEAMMRRFSIRHEVKNMSHEELFRLAMQYIHATETDDYVSEKEAEELAATCLNPGQLMPELIRIVGGRIYQEKESSIQEEEETRAEEAPYVWEVTYTWKKNVAAETMEDAIAIGRRERIIYSMGGASEEYSAKRAEFIGPADGKQK